MTAAADGDYASQLQAGCAEAREIYKNQQIKETPVGQLGHNCAANRQSRGKRGVPGVAAASGVLQVALRMPDRRAA